MSIYVIADLHLSFNESKPMDIFGDNWQNHEEKIRQDWLSKVKPEDTVLHLGDFSWGMSLEDTLKDFEYINKLPGKKILLKGNHDYWWTTVTSMKKFLIENNIGNMDFLHNNFFEIEDKVICGTRGWTLTYTDEIEFNGNIYLINDFKYDLTIDEMRKADDCKLTLNHYYDAIKDIFQDGDIIVGYSLGCIYASLIAERLEKTKTIAECILIDGTLKFQSPEKRPREEMINDLMAEEGETYNYIAKNYPTDFKDKFLEVSIINAVWSFTTPKINSHITYLATSDRFRQDLMKVSTNYEFVYVDSTHEGIIDMDCDKIAKYFNP